MLENLVSIIVPTYNRGSLIKETIQSVIDQTYTNWELIVVDDGSEDDTENVVDRFNNLKIKYYRIAHCGILASVRGEGLKHASGNLIAFLDSDDVWLPNKLEHQLRLLHQHNEVAFIFGHGRQFGEGAIPPPELENFFIGNVFLPILIEERFVFYVPTVMFKKEVIGKIDPIDSSLISGGDIDFFLRMAHQFTGIFSNEIIVGIRKHKQNTSGRFEFIAYLDYLKMLEKFKKNNWLTNSQFKKIISKQYYRLALLYYKKDHRKEAIRFAMKYISVQPFHYKGWIRFLQFLFVPSRS